MIGQATNIEAIREVPRRIPRRQVDLPSGCRALVRCRRDVLLRRHATLEDVVYLTDDGTLTEKMHLPLDPVAEGFSKSGIVAAIRAAQRDEIRYPEFMRPASAAGVVGYWAFLTGKRVIYFGRKGEFHVEEFPGATHQAE